MNKFYFDTGVKPWNSARVFADEEWYNGTKRIPFYADAPADAHLMFLCDDPERPESEAPDVIVRRVFNTSLVSQYAYFRLPRVKETVDG